MKENKNNDKSVLTENFGATEHKMDKAKTDLSIVGIGASAGGLEALSAFLRNVPNNSGLAFVIVQHMEDNSKDILGGLLQGDTSMKVTGL